MRYKVTIIGGGPAGMMAAITAAKCGAKVCLIEHNDRVGKKILSTGNGKCNLTNMNISEDCYRSDSKESCFCVIEKFMPDKLREFFLSIGLMTKEKAGYVYPNSEQAASVLDALRYEMERLNIDVMTGINVKQISKGFVIHTDRLDVATENIILACGSMCAPKTGSDGSGYTLAKSFGHRIITPIPALVQIKCQEKVFKELAGVRTEAIVTLTVNGEKVINELGELQLTEYGISGIPVFQISRFIKRELDRNNKPVVHINFMPDYNDRKLNGILTGFVGHNPSLEIKDALNGILNKKISPVILRQSGIRPSEICQNITASNIKTIVRNILDFKVTPVDTNGFDNAQVCAGGVDLAQINLDTMESRIVNKLYFAGEILDVDGKCGGYNLQWAFASGRLAGLSAVR